jgi:hypothetical protein
VLLRCLCHLQNSLMQRELDHMAELGARQEQQLKCAAAPIVPCVSLIQLLLSTLRWAGITFYMLA